MFDLTKAVVGNKILLGDAISHEDLVGDNLTKDAKTASTKDLKPCKYDRLTYLV